jgi:hypothetical protein
VDDLGSCPWFAWEKVAAIYSFINHFDETWFFFDHA